MLPCVTSIFDADQSIAVALTLPASDALLTVKAPITTSMECLPSSSAVGPRDSSFQ